MPRKRKIETEYHIKYVHIANGRIVYRPYIKQNELHDEISVDQGGFLKPPVLLGKPGDDPDKIMDNYRKAKIQITRDNESTKKNTLGYIIEQYENSNRFKELADSSQIRNKNLRKIMDFPIKIQGKQETLKNLPIDAISKPLFHNIAEKRLANYRTQGKEGSVQVNREITFICTALSWATNHIHNLGILHNPLLKFEKFNEPKNTVYVSDERYDIQYEEAAKIADYLQPVFELTYLLASRGIETLDIKLSECLDEGIFVKRRKGSINNIIEWSERLETAYNTALLLHEKIDTLPDNPYLIIGSNGEKLPKSTLNSAMQRLKKHMNKKGLGGEYWSLHKLKSKGVSDSEDKKIAGHKSETMRQRYDTKVPSHKAVR